MRTEKKIERMRKKKNNKASVTSFLLLVSDGLEAPEFCPFAPRSPGSQEFWGAWGYRSINTQERDMCLLSFLSTLPFPVNLPFLLFFPPALFILFIYFSLGTHTQPYISTVVKCQNLFLQRVFLFHFFFSSACVLVCPFSLRVWANVVSGYTVSCHWVWGGGSLLACSSMA